MRVEQYNVFILIQSIPINMKEERNLEDRLKTQESQITFWKDQKYWYFVIINAKMFPVEKHKNWKKIFKKIKKIKVFGEKTYFLA